MMLKIFFQKRYMYMIHTMHFLKKNVLGGCESYQRGDNSEDCPEVYILCITVQGSNPVSGIWYFMVNFILLLKLDSLQFYL